MAIPLLTVWAIRLLTMLLRTLVLSTPFLFISFSDSQTYDCNAILAVTFRELNATLSSTPAAARQLVRLTLLTVGHNKMLNELKHLALFLPSYTFQSHFSFLCTLVIHFTQQFRVQSRRMVVDRQQGLLLGLVCLHAPLQVILKT